MLTVWIDDCRAGPGGVSAPKETEASRPARGDDGRSPRALWSIVKQQRIFVHIPCPADRVLNVANRRVAMLFDPDRARGPPVPQREGKETWGGPDRGDPAGLRPVRLYAAINRGRRAGLEDDGTKRRRSPPSRMGWESFTVGCCKGDGALLPPGPKDPAGLHREGHDLLRPPRGVLPSVWRTRRSSTRAPGRPSAGTSPLPVRPKLPGVGGRPRSG